MSEIRTLVEMLEHRARTEPAGRAFRFEGVDVAYGELWRRAGRLAGHLRQRGVEPGDRVILILPNGPEFFYGFYGTLRLGAIAVPVFPGSGAERVAQRALHCGARHIVLPTDLEAARRASLEDAVDSAQEITSFGACSQVPVPDDLPGALPDAVAMLQYTSGSTGNPKGVQLSHDNLITNVQQVIAGMSITRDEVFVSWLPVYHDMGLIIKTMVPFYLGAELILLPTSLTNVRSWLRAIDDYRGTFTAAPDFAYRLCLRSIRDPSAYDLSSLRVALNAAEPVRASTIRAFEEAFGLDKVMAGGYGLAEATVGVSMWQPGQPPVVDKRGLVSVGQPFPEIELRIVGEDQELEPGEIGDILIRSAANTCGYWENASATEELKRPEGFIVSGDLGYLDERGNLYIAGRSKDIIIVAGRNLAPQELEEIVDARPEVRFSAAVGIDRGKIEGEQAYVFAEIRKRMSDDEYHDLVVDIVELLHERLGMRPGRVYLLKPRAIPRTYNGKVQHRKLRESYLSGELQREGQILFPEY